MRVFPIRVALDRPSSDRRFRRGREGQSALTLLALALASAVTPIVLAPPALAQSRANATRPDQTPAEDRRTTTPRRQQPDRAPADETATVGEPEADQSRLTDTRGMAPQRPATGGAVAAGGAGGAGNEATDAGDGDIDPDVGDGAQRLAATRRPGDGDLRVTEPQALRDGDVPVEPVQVVIDGELELIDDMAAADPELEDALRELERPDRKSTRLNSSHSS